MHPVQDLKLLFLVAIANGVPVLAHTIMGELLAHPIDCHARFVDGRPLLGTSKTFRGLLLSFLATTLVSAGIGMGWAVGILIAVSAMAGDLVSSFIKRRAGAPVSSMAFGLDQLPESLLPALATMKPLGLTSSDVIAVCAIFLVAELALSRVLYRFHLRDRPY